MDLLVRIARETLPLVHHRFKVDYTGNWHKVADALVKENQIYGAIEAISGTGNWPMTQNEFGLWQDYFFMHLAEYCHRDEVISLEWPLIRHIKFREQLQFIGSLKKVTRANGRRELIDQLIDSPISEKLFQPNSVEGVVRENERNRLLKLFERMDEEERLAWQEKDAENAAPEVALPEERPVDEPRASEVDKKPDTENAPEVIRLKEEDRVPTMAFATATEPRIPSPQPPVLEPTRPQPADIRQEEQEQAYKEAYQIFREGKRYELAGNFLKALDSYYYCRQLLVQAPPARELYGDCMSAIARCTAKLEHKKRMADAELQDTPRDKPRKKSLGYRLFWTSLVLAWVTSVAYAVYIYYGDQLMPYMWKAIDYLQLAIDRFRP